MYRAIVILAVLLIAGSALAQDPGVRDSLIIETVFAELGDSTIDVRIYATTDDSIGFYNMPIAWYSSDSAIYPTDITYYNVVVYWDIVEDSILYDPGFIRLVGWCDMAGPDNPPIITNNIRVHYWTIRFSINPQALPQVVVIDTTFDPIWGSLLFGIEGGIETFVPVLTSGAIYYGITTDVDEKNQNLPDDFILLSNYPNPFNASTTIEFTLPEEAEIELAIYNILGQKIDDLVNEHKPAGKHSLVWHSEKLPSGVYFARLEKEGKWKTMRMLLLK